MNVYKKTLLFLGVLLSFGWMSAQERLEIQQIFEKYGKQQDAILVELSSDVLGGNTQMTFYQSLIVPFSNDLQHVIQQAFRRDIANGIKLIESQKNGVVETGYYYLKKNRNEDEYILFKSKSKKITLAYIQGNFPPQQLEDELNKLKDLFIYVNNKRIKLQ